MVTGGYRLSRKPEREELGFRNWLKTKNMVKSEFILLGSAIDLLELMERSVPARGVRGTESDAGARDCQASGLLEMRRLGKRELYPIWARRESGLIAARISTARSREWKAVQIIDPHDALARGP
jgi:hypothetical protein